MKTLYIRKPLWMELERLYRDSLIYSSFDGGVRVRTLISKLFLGSVDKGLVVANTLLESYENGCEMMPDIQPDVINKATVELYKEGFTPNILFFMSPFNDVLQADEDSYKDYDPLFYAVTAYYEDSISTIPVVSLSSDLRSVVKAKESPISGLHLDKAIYHRGYLVSGEEGWYERVEEIKIKEVRR